MSAKTGSRAISYGTVANWQVGRGYPKMIIMCCGGGDEGVYYPPQSVEIVSRQSLLNLREAIDEVLAEETFNTLKKA